MIEINLLPGARRQKRGGGGGGGGKSINFAAIGAAIASSVKDKYLAAAVVTTALALAAIGYLYASQQAREGSLREQEAKQVADSARYAVVLLDRVRAQARRDSALMQLSIIKAIDADRFIWPHVMDEISRALPIYTWLQSVGISGTPQGTNPAAAVKTPPPDTGKVRRPRRDPVLPRDTVRIRMVGRTVDLQAFTRFMRSLEDSPYLESVSLQQSLPVIQGGKDLNQFTLDLMYSRPDTMLLRRSPFMPSQR